MAAADNTAEKTEARVRNEIAKLLLAEFQYWLDSTDERAAEVSIGAMGATANVLAAVLFKTKPETFRKQIEARDGR